MFCDDFLEDVKGETCAFHAQTKYGIEFVFSKAVELLSYCVHKYNTYKETNKSGDPILYEETLDRNNDNKTSAEEKMETNIESNTFFNNQ